MRFHKKMGKFFGKPSWFTTVRCALFSNLNRREIILYDYSHNFLLAAKFQSLPLVTLLIGMAHPIGRSTTLGHIRRSASGPVRFAEKPTRKRFPCPLRLARAGKKVRNPRSFSPTTGKGVSGPFLLHSANCKGVIVAGAVSGLRVGHQSTTDDSRNLFETPPKADS
jgi:hypothetical protein